MRGTRATMVGALMVLLATGCGSTAQVHRLARAGDAAAELSGTPEANGAPEQTQAAPDGVVAAVPGAPKGGATVRSTTPTRTASTPGELRIGLVRYNPPGDFGSTFGIRGVVVGNVDDYNEALLSWYKRHPIMGHRLVPVFHDLESNSTASYEAQFQARCETFRDGRVRVVFDSGTDAFQACVAKLGALTFSTFIGEGDQERLRRSPTLFAPLAADYDRLSRVYVDGLHGAGFLSPSSRIGLLYVDCPEFDRAVSRSLAPALAAHGLQLAEKFGGRCRRSDAEVSAAAAEVSNAVLRFKTRGIDRVLLLTDTLGIGEVLFMQQAEGQQYRPKYGLTSLSAAQAVLAAGEPSNAPPAQLSGSVGVGTFPLIDVEASTVGPLNANEQRCLDILKAEGIGPAIGAADLVNRFALCENFFLLEAAVTEAGGALDRAAIVGGAERLGVRHQAAGTIATRLAAGRHDGVAAYRMFRYVDECTCFRYTGGPVAMP